jgi:hypothetical protein
MPSSLKSSLHIWVNSSKQCLPPASTLVFRTVILWPWRCRRYVPPKSRLTFNRFHGVIFQKIVSPLWEHQILRTKGVPQLLRTLSSNLQIRLRVWMKTYYHIAQYRPIGCTWMTNGTERSSLCVSSCIKELSQNVSVRSDQTHAHLTQGFPGSRSMFWDRRLNNQQHWAFQALPLGISSELTLYDTQSFSQKETEKLLQPIFFLWQYTLQFDIKE